eukprot:647336-Prymnesium_polylepis.1
MAAAPTSVALERPWLDVGWKWGTLVPPLCTSTGLSAAAGAARRPGRLAGPARGDTGTGLSLQTPLFPRYDYGT